MAKKPMESNWADNILSSKDKATDYQSAVLFGQFGAGKTKFAASWPKPFFIAAEDGMLTLLKEDIPYIKLNPEFSIYQTVMEIFANAAMRAGPFEDVQTLVIDSISKLHRMVKQEILEESGREKAEFDDWDKLRSRMNRLNNFFIRLPYNRLAICTEALKEDKFEKVLKPTFNIDGGFRDDMPGEYDHVWYFGKRQVGRVNKFIMNTDDFRGRTAKRRVELPDEIENANYQIIIDHIKGAL